METLRKIIEEKKRKGEEKKPYYGICKLSVGIVSCMLGHLLFFASPVVVSAVEATPEDVSIIQMQSVKGEAIERSATLVAVTGATGIRAASGNIDSENLGYAPNAKYSFQDLKFDPEKLSKTNSARQIQFKIYGKHNIAASTDNWKINLQIDERIAKHVIGIEVEPKRLTEANPRPIRRALTRKSDTIGRMTNIWEVNYIRSENGVFAGGETTDTQTAHNGIIYLDKPLNKILEEIGDENLTNERLFYRIYLTSVQDKGAIVPGIASTGFFKINGLDIQIETIESSGNEKWFKHAAVEGRYVRSDKFKNPGGAINQNGAIVVDHKISKNTNFAYISAKNKPWTLEYGVDPRLVKYIGGIELYYMDAADYVNPDYSLKNKANRKVRDLSIVRTAGHKKYGYGDITENQFTQIVDVHGGRPEPITIRYVYKLNKPINEILEELRREAGVEEGEAFGKDFIFSAWITDKTKDALITNTYGTGYYRIQDIDGDGKLDEEEANNEQSPYIGVPKITAPYEGDNKVKAVVHLNENAGKGNKAQLINKNGVVVATINNVDAEENGIPKTIDRELEFTVTDSSVLGKAGDKLTVKIIPSDERYEKAEEAETKVKEAPKAVKDPLRVVKGKDLTEDTVLAKKGVENSNKMPGGTTYRWKTAPNTSQAGNTTGIVSVTVPDREEAFEVTVPIEVFLADADKYTPQTTSIIKEYGTSTTEEEIIGAVTVPGYPEDTVDELEIALDNATQIPDGNTAGDYPVDVTVTYPDGSEDKVQVTVTVKEQKDNEKYIPEFDQINKNYGEATTEEEIKGALKEESVPENMEVTVKNPENLPDGMTEGTFEIEVTVEYPDGTSEDTTVQVVVTDNRTDAEKYTPEFDQIEKNYGEATTEEEIKGALKEESVPENTEVTVKNPENLPDGMTEGTFEIEVTVEYPDGTSEDTTVQVVVTDNRTDAEKYTPEFDQIEKNYGEATTEEEIKGALKEESVPENTEVTVKNPESLPDGMTEGTFEIEVTVEYPDGTSEDTTVQVVVTDNRTDAEKYTPEFDQIEKNYGEATTEEEIKGALKEESVPENTEVTVKNPESLPDGMTEGTFEIEVTVEYPDGTSEDTTVQVVVTDNFLVVTKNPPKQIDGQRVAENTNVITANLTFTVEGVHDEGLNSGLSIDENGNLTGTPKLNWGDKNSDTYEEQTVVLHAIATAESGSKKPVTISVVVQRDTDGDGEPDITDTDDDGDGFTDIEEEEKGTDPKDPNSVPQVDPIVAPTIGEIEDQTVVEGNAITPVTPEVTEGSNVTVEGLPEGVMFENGTIQGTPKVTWNGSEESRAITVTVKAEKDGATGRETFVITVQRDTDGDGEPDITDTDDDGDGFTDIEEEEKGTDPKDPNSVPQVDPIVAPTIGEIEDQTVVEGNAITPVTPEVTEGSNVTVEGLPEGVMFENGTIQGTPKVTWNGSEESRAITVTVKAEKDGATGRETFVITVQRDTDGDGEPDITDTDDDGDGFTDIEEEEKGTDPKDPNSVPQVDPKPVKPDQKQDPEISQNKVVNNVVNNSYKKPISNAPKTGDFGNGTGYTGLAALAAGLMLLLGIKKKRKEEDGEE
ncbi:Rib/alpha-like domain-containing protein [[Ruminococcus] torques]|uniref:Rib/alpha-like domain-containing protein n=2 Tax=[Ruminococcus] torques TaxID=33039 RepID=UPI0027BAECE8|nr:Rib/alpha-like domain-containing protein [[Ruminococcus] torques]